MLKLVKIVKDYQMKDQEPVHALKGLSVNFRRNEFVAILGPSGCGKTTLLNITGGLDRYTSGDLIIDGVSTKNYSDADWDTYRNHSIGFVFQSYNLIPHQTILKNVELALTISGIEKEERRQRAISALEKVGLKGLEKKKPNQLSGGQMQRVAIARALVNEPEIVLADEPTGALDSETSVQIMDLLKEVAKDCLVIMVTHNPDLADAYANRIVRMKDGELLSDSNPFSDEDEAKEIKELKEKPIEKSNKGNKKRSSMSFFTATALSFSNLLSKFKRTVLIAVAGSIGIIGVSSVLAVKHGVQNYIDDMQDDMLSNYPLTISEKSVDYTSLMSGLSNWDEKVIADFDLTSQVGIDSMVDYLMNKYNDIMSFKTNDINDDLINYVEQIDPELLASITHVYAIDPTNNIFTTWNSGRDGASDQNISLNGLTQMYISELNTVPDFGTYAAFVSLFTDFMKQLPYLEDGKFEEYIASQYDFLGDSRMAKNENEMVVVVDDNQTLTDILFAQLGFYSEKQFIDLAQSAVEENQAQKEGREPDLSFVTEEIPEAFDFDVIKDKKFYYIPDLYEYDSTTKKDSVVIPSIDLKDLFGKSSPVITSFQFEYDAEPDTLLGMSNLSTSALLLTRKEGTVNTGNWTGTWQGYLNYGVKIPFLMEIDPAMTVTISALGASTDPAPYVTTEKYINAYTYEAVQNQIISEYKADKTSHPEVKEMKIVGILKRKAGINFGALQRGIYFTPQFCEKYMKDTLNINVVASKEAGKEGIIEYIDQNKDQVFKACVKYTYTSYANGDANSGYTENVLGWASSLNTDLTDTISSMVSISGVSTVDTNRNYLRSLCGLSSSLVSASVLNPRYKVDVDKRQPKTIKIFPKDFQAKEGVTKHLNKWNNDETLTIVDRKTGNTYERTASERSELTYTDTVEMIINIINTLVLTITIALIAFTSLALLVSCFMIAVI
nr:ABC transporter ATP-binding protein [Bacilli bacterium]